MRINIKLHWEQIAPTLFVVLAVVGQYALRDLVGLRPFLFLFPAVVAGALWGRLVAGAVATCVAAVAFFAFFPPRLSGALEKGSDALLAGGFLAVGLVVNYLSMQLRKSRSRERILQARVNRLIDSNIVGIVSWTIEGGVTEANDVFLQMIGYSRQELEQGKVDWRKLTPPEWEYADALAYSQIQEHGAHHPMEKEFYRKDGTRVPIIVGGARYQGLSNEGVSFILDISEQKKIREDLADAVVVRDEFLSVASHELKTPLTSLLLQSDLLLRRLDRDQAGVFDPEQIKRLGELTRKQIERLGRLVDDMLDVSRIQSGHLSLHVDSVDLCALVREMAERLAPAAMAAGAGLRVELPPEPVVGRCDAFRIEQVVTNLLTNAIRYGGAKPVAVSVAVVEQAVRISVADQGSGISHEDRERIFNRFERASSSRATSGLGLGLFIARVIVELHGGQIWVESAGRGRGSAFHVELPLPMASAPRPEPSPV